MSMSNLIYKKECEYSENDPFYISEFMIFQDNLTIHRFALLLLFNNSQKTLSEAELEITEFDHENQPIKKSLFIVQDLEINPNDKTVLMEKYKVLPRCTSITCKIRPLITKDYFPLINEEEEIVEKIEKLKWSISVMKQTKIRFPYLILLMSVALFVGLIILVFILTN